jgi:MarR family
VTRRSFHHLLKSIGVLRHACDLDLLLFFHRHPRALLTSERLAAYVGYDLDQIARSLDRLTDEGLLERSQNPTHAARMYVLKMPESGWLQSLFAIAATRDGRRELIQTMQKAASGEAGPETARDGSAAAYRLRKTGMR